MSPDDGPRWSVGDLEAKLREARERGEVSGVVSDLEAREIVYRDEMLAVSMSFAVPTNEPPRLTPELMSALAYVQSMKDALAGGAG